MRRQAEDRLESLLLEGLNSGAAKPIDWQAIGSAARWQVGGGRPAEL